MYKWKTASKSETSKTKYQIQHQHVAGLRRTRATNDKKKKYMFIRARPGSTAGGRRCDPNLKKIFSKKKKVSTGVARRTIAI